MSCGNAISSLFFFWKISADSYTGKRIWAFLLTRIFCSVCLVTKWILILFFFLCFFWCLHFVWRQLLKLHLYIQSFKVFVALTSICKIKKLTGAGLSLPTFLTSNCIKFCKEMSVSARQHRFMKKEKKL